MEQRKYLEDERGDCNEVVLIDQRGLAMEGTQTNFFAIVDDCVRTASAAEVRFDGCSVIFARFKQAEQVLPGTVRNIVLDVCKQAGIAVKEQAPSLRELDRWSAACVTSTSRLALPIDKVDKHPCQHACVQYLFNPWQAA